MKTEIVHIFTCENKGEPMIEHKYREAVTGKGLYNDRYNKNTGAYSQKDPRKRQVTFIALEAIETANSTLTTPFLPKETRRNIVTRGINLNSLVGKQFKIGSVVFKGTELADPCKRPSLLVGKDDFDKAFRNNGGLRAEVVYGGMITIGEMTFTVLE